MKQRNAVWVVMALFFVSLPTVLLLYVHKPPLLPTTKSGAPYLMVLPFLLLPIMIMLAFGSNARTLVTNRRLRRTGIPTTGVLLDSQPTGNFINGIPVLRLMVQLETGETVAFEHLHHWGSMVARGMRLDLLVDPKDHRKAMLA